LLRSTEFIPEVNYNRLERILTLPKSENILEDILEKWRRGSRGPLPQLSPLQLLNALLLIDREGPLGRRALASALQLNDGVIRGLLERLAESKMVTVTETGVQLSKVGRESLRKLLRQLSIKKIISIDQSDLVSANSVMGVHATRLYRTGMTGIVQRDEAIKAGAEGSITVAVLGKKLVIPPDNKSIAELAPKENARLRSELEPTDKDLIIIGFGKDPGRALAGALAAVLSLQKA
jgi:uncharacterized protein DUF4443/CggR-like protein